MSASSHWWKQRYIKQYVKIWTKVKYRSKVSNSDDSDQKHVKIKFNSDAGLHLKKKICNTKILAKSVFYDDIKNYQHDISDKCLYKI